MLMNGLIPNFDNNQFEESLHYLTRGDRYLIDELKVYKNTHPEYVIDNANIIVVEDNFNIFIKDQLLKYLNASGEDVEIININRLKFDTFVTMAASYLDKEDDILDKSLLHLNRTILRFNSIKNTSTTIALKSILIPGSYHPRDIRKGATFDIDILPLMDNIILINMIKKFYQYL